MAKTKIVVYKRTVLELDEDEARYLRGLTQDYLGGHISDEPPEEEAIRERLFVVLSQANRGLQNG